MRASGRHRPGNPPQCLPRRCTVGTEYPGGGRTSLRSSCRRRTSLRPWRGGADRAGLAADRLELEITERVMLTDTETALSALGRLRALGVHISLDDFGTGYSSLSYLQKFPVDRIKVDRSFVRNLGHRDGGGGHRFGPWSVSARSLASARWPRVSRRRTRPGARLLATCAQGQG